MLTETHRDNISTSFHCFFGYLGIKVRWDSENFHGPRHSFQGLMLSVYRILAWSAVLSLQCVHTQSFCYLPVQTSLLTDGQGRHLRFWSRLEFPAFRFKVKYRDGNKPLLDTNDYPPLYPVLKCMIPAVSLKQSKSDNSKKSYCLLPQSTFITTLLGVCAWDTN